MKTINTSERLFDLVRYQRSALLNAGLITEEEYGWLCSSEMAMSPKGGSPSRKRLEEYDEMKARIIVLETAAQGLRDALEKITLGFVPDCYKAVAIVALARFDALKEGKQQP